MRRTALTAALLALVATACSDGGGSPTASPSASVTTPATTSSIVSPSSAPPSPSWPAGCASPQALQPGWTVIEATVSGGTVTPPRRTYDVKLKSIVRVIVRSDKADEVHVHTYDRKAPVTPTCPGIIDFEAGIAGSVEVELEDAGLHLFQVRAR